MVCLFQNLELISVVDARGAGGAAVVCYPLASGLELRLLDLYGCARRLNPLAGSQRLRDGVSISSAFALPASLVSFTSP